MRRRTLLLAVVIAGVLGAAIVTSFALGQGGIGGGPPPYKIAVEATQRALQATRESLPRALKPPLSPTPVASCPDTQIKSGIHAYQPMGPQYLRAIVNEALVVTNDVYYRIFAGSPIDQPTRGMLYVMPRRIDPCAATLAGKTPIPDRTLITPKGPLTITQIDGDVVVVSIPGVGTDRFNVVTGAFAHTTPIPRPYP